MVPTTTDTLDVPGAHLHYEIRGSGPVLLLIPGGPADSSAFTDLAPLLAENYTVVTYDPRGLSNSTIDDPDDDIPVATQADDAHRLLKAVTAEPAYVFGNSGGAITGLALVTTHPGQVRTLVAHEPPVTQYLPDGAGQLAAVEDIHQTYVRGGVGPAMAKFMTHAGFDGGPADAGPRSEPDPETLEAMARIQVNIELFLAKMIRPTAHYTPTVEAMRDSKTRIVVAAGTASSGQPAHEAAVGLAKALGTTPTPVPGAHGGFAEEPQAFASILNGIFTD
jgi:pimeloyl-ACP methyl ester carboxylesterase